MKIHLKLEEKRMRYTFSPHFAVGLLCLAGVASCDSAAHKKSIQDSKKAVACFEGDLEFKPNPGGLKKVMVYV